MDPTCKLAGVNLFIFSTRGRKTSRKNQEEKPNIVTNFDGDNKRETEEQRGEGEKTRPNTRPICSRLWVGRDSYARG